MNLSNILTSCISLQKEKESVAQYCDGIIGFNSSPRNFFQFVIVGTYGRNYMVES